MKKNYSLAVCCFVITIAFTFSSCVAYFTGNFQGAKFVKDSNDNYVELNDGSIIHGGKIKWGRLFSSAVIINDQKFKASEVKGIKENGIYRLNTSGGFLERIVDGKITILRDMGTRTTTSTVNGHLTTSTYSYTQYYMLRANDEKLIAIRKNDDIKNMISSCPKALALMDLSKKQMKRAIKENPAYLNQVFETYNNDCKEPEGKKRINW
jgi:hypothetical protein